MKHFTPTFFLLFILSNIAFASSSDSLVFKGVVKSNQLKYIYSYDDYGRRTDEESYCTNTTTNKKIRVSKLHRTYTESGLVQDETLYLWSAVKKMWIPNSYTVFSYDMQGNKALEELFVWNEKINSWDGSFKYEMTYDSKNNMMSCKHYKWSETQEWVMFEQKIMDNYEKTALNQELKEIEQEYLCPIR